MEQYGFPHSNGEHILKDFRQFLILQKGKKRAVLQIQHRSFSNFIHIT